MNKMKILYEKGAKKWDEGNAGSFGEIDCCVALVTDGIAVWDGAHLIFPFHLFIYSVCGVLSSLMLFRNSFAAWSVLRFRRQLFEIYLFALCSLALCGVFRGRQFVIDFDTLYALPIHFFLFLINSMTLRTISCFCNS